MGLATLLAALACGGVYDAAEKCAAAYMDAHPGLPDKWMKNNMFGGLKVDEYVGMVPGADGVPNVNMMDGPNGLRDILSGQTLANRTSWPSAGVHGLALIPELSYFVGRAGSRDFATVGAGVQLGPGVCIHRVPINGRNWEYISGEEATIGELGGYVVRGIQSNNVMATAKHWAMNNQELNRKGNLVVIDEGAMMETYLRAYDSQIKEGTGAFMCSYNRVEVKEHNETQAYMCGSKEVTGRLLRKVMGFKGLVMTDWGNEMTSVTNGVAVENRGVAEWEMNWSMALRLKVPKNETLRNELAKHSLVGMYVSGMFPGQGCKTNAPAPSVAHLPKMYQSAMQSENATELGAILAAEGTVLLKKSAEVPFKGPKQILLAGEAMLSGGGSGDNGAFGYEQAGHHGENLSTGGITAQRAMKAALSTDGSTAFWDYEIPAAAEPDVVILFGAQYRSEGYLVNQQDGFLNVDRCDSANARNNVHGASYGSCKYAETIQKLKAKYPKALFISFTTVGGAHIAHDYLDLVDTAYTTFYPGQHFARALSMMLTGAVSPGGKLSYTMPAAEKGPDGKTYIQSPISRFNPGLVFPSERVTLHVPAYAWDEGANKVSSVVQYGHNTSVYSEGALVGYKYYEKYGMKPLFPFGHGLSYASTSVASHSNTCDSAAITKGCTVAASVSIDAPSGMVASEVVHVFVGYTSSNPANDALRPVRTLRAFKKVWTTGTYYVDLKAADFQSTWSPAKEQWVTPCAFDNAPGTFHVLLGDHKIASFPCRS